MNQTIDETDNIYGRWTVLERDKSNKFRQTCWMCRCSCGVIRSVVAFSLRNGTSKSCGCGIKYHSGGITGTPTHRSWANMKDRCSRANNEDYHNYGGRGIVFCESWKKYKNFLSDMGIKPVGTSLDRIDNDGDYSPDNCRWATPKEQANNRRTNHLLNYKGRTQNITQWAKEIGIKTGTLSCRINDLSWSVEKSLTTNV